MREIFFKAKRIDTGEWVEGYYIYHIKRTPCVFGDSVKPEDEQHVIMQDGFSDWNMPRNTVHYDIDPSTLCQYTGLTDKNGRKIWENDILKHYNKVQVDDFESYEVGVVTWNKSICRFVNYNSIRDEQYTVCDWCVYEVIGNVFDNPELLEKAR